MNGVRKTVAAIGLVAGLAGTVRAGDFCPEWDIPQHLVGKGFRVPPPGRCRPFLGVVYENGSDLSGSACTTNDGSAVRFALTETAPTGDPQVSGVKFYNVRLPLPLGPAGNLNYHFLPMSAAQLGGLQDDVVTGGACKTPMPIY